MLTLEDVMATAGFDRAFDEQLRQAVKNAVNQAIPSSQWVQLMTYFAETPEELDELSDPYNISNPELMCAAFRTALAYTSAACPTTLYIGQDSGKLTAKKPAKSVGKGKQPRKPAKKTKRSAK
jgi:hypothetical protein